jgi:CheY-like chemotaxis protein
MIDPDELRWLCTTVNDLNNLLQIVSKTSDSLQPLCEVNPDGIKNFSFLKKSMERADGIIAQLGAHLGGIADLNQMLALQPKPVTSPTLKETKIKILNPEGPRELILIIDDEQIICELVGEMLAGQGYRVVSAFDPFRALEMYRELKDEIGLIILDFTLPIMDGSEVFDELRKIKPDVTVMLSSGFAEQGKVRAMLAKGLRGFLPKPYTEEKLLTQVRVVLDSLRSEKTGERRVL